MSNKLNPYKVTVLVMLGNMLEYYDFLLFMHLGPLITPLFFPGFSSKETHFLSLLLFGMAFVIRPIGGYFFGRISDLKGRKKALVISVRWALVPAFGLAILPSYETLGVLSTYLFVFLRLFQGIALGGEYPNAGTYLMEYYKNRHGFISGILAASGTVGSLLGFGLALLCSMDGAPSWMWRTGFLLGGIAGFISYRMRKVLIELPAPMQSIQKTTPHGIVLRWALVVMIGMLVGTSLWLPMTYSNFYITKILEYPVDQGLLATFIALVAYVLLTPIWGAVSDRFNCLRYMMTAAIILIPMNLLSFFLLSQGRILIAQLGLIIAASAFGAPIHAVMNSLFPPQTRGRSVALLFMAGLSIGGVAPSVAGYIVDQTGFQFAPAILVTFAAFSTAMLFNFQKDRLEKAYARVLIL